MATKQIAEKVSLLSIVDGLNDKLNRISCLRHWAHLSHDDGYSDGAFMAIYMMRDYVEDAIALKEQLDQLRKESSATAA